jgi:hypothetical protein
VDRATHYYGRHISYMSIGAYVGPIALFFDKVSDHAPISVRIGARKPARPGHHPIAPAYFKHDLYHGCLEEALPAGYKALPVRAGHATLKLSMAAAANRVRKYLF